MLSELQIIQEQLQQLRQAGLQLAESLLASANQLEVSDEASLLELLKEVNSYRNMFHECSRVFGQNDGSVGHDVFFSVDDLENALERRTSERRAIEIARSILTLEAVNRQTIIGLSEIQSEAHDLIATHGRHLTADQLAEFDSESHEWCALLRMVDEAETLDDADWNALNDQLMARIGAPLAIAAARGRLLSKALGHELSTLPNEAPASADRATPAIRLMREEEYEDCPTQPREEQQLLDDASTSLATGSVEVATDQIRCSSGEDELVTVTSETHDQTEPSTWIVQDSGDLSCNPSVPPTPPVIPVTNTTPIRSAVRGVPSLEMVHASSLSTPSEIVVELPSSIEKAAPGDQPTLPQLEDRQNPAIQGESSSAVGTAGLVWDDLQEQESSNRSTNQISGDSRSSIFDEDPDQDERWISSNSIEREPMDHDKDMDADQGVSPLAEKLLSSSRFDSASGPIASLASMILSRAENERDELLPDLIFHLIHQGRPGLAFHLARCLERFGSTRRPFVPSWLIRVWTFGHAVVFPKGQLSGLLQDDLKHYRSTSPSNSNRQWQHAMSLLIRAATLRPAIIAPITGAASVLRDFDLQSGSIQLYNFCSRIGAYGERLQGVLPGLFKQSGSSVPYSDQLTQLKRDIENWRETIEAHTIQLQLVAPLYQKAGWSLRAGSGLRRPQVATAWSQWQVALRQGHSLVQPILADQRAEMSRIRGEVEEITARLATIEHHEGTSPLLLPEIRAYLRQAVTFAQSWIGLHGVVASADMPNYLPQPAAELRSEIQQRYAGVMQELQPLVLDEQSFEVRMSVACLMLSVMEVRKLIEPGVATELREADPRHLLHSELMKISGLRLGANWEPDENPHVLLQEILSFLCQPQPDWIMAFKMHMAQGNHHLAERILSLAFWTESEKRTLLGVLESDRHRVRTDFLKGLARVRTLLNETIHLDLLSETERSGFETRVSRLDLIADSETDLKHGVQELELVQESLTIRREREAERIRGRLQRLNSAPEATNTNRVNTDTDNIHTTRISGWTMDFRPFTSRSHD